MYIILDTETTSLHPGQIGQLSYIIADETYTPICAKNFFFTVEYMSPVAEQVHGFSREKLYELSQGKKFIDHREEIYEDIQQNILIAHNATFDIKFLKAEFERCDLVCKPKDIQCSMRYFTPICRIPYNGTRSGYKRPKVAELLQYFKIDGKKIDATTRAVFDTQEVGFHDARYDTTAVLLALQANTQSSSVPDQQSPTQPQSDFFPLPSDEQLATMQPADLISYAIQQEKKLSITYIKTGNVKSYRVISPEKLGNIGYFGRMIYGLQAFCHEKQAKRVFSLEKISHIQIL